MNGKPSHWSHVSQGTALAAALAIAALAACTPAKPTTPNAASLTPTAPPASAQPASPTPDRDPTVMTPTTGSVPSAPATTLPIAPIPVPTPTAPTPLATVPPPLSPDRRMLVPARLDDLFPQALRIPDQSKITLVPGEDGFAEIRGGAGAIPGALPVYVVSSNTANATLTRSSSDGGFSARIVAPPGSWVIVKYDPTDGLWLGEDVLSDPRPTSVNAAPSVIMLVPYSSPQGTGTPFVISGSTFPGHTDFTLAGTMTGSYAPGGHVAVTGTVTVYAPQQQAPRLAGQTLSFHTQLVPNFDANGNARTMANQFYSTILTPTGLPIEHWLGATPASGPLETGPLQQIPGAERLEAPFTFTLDLPPGIPAATYALWVESFADTDVSLGGSRPEVNPFMANHAFALPPFTVGEPKSPRLVWTLLTDVPSADGSRGTIAEEDKASFQLASRIATQSNRFVVPPFSKATRQPIIYRLEPYLPMVAHGDRYIPNVPNVTFKFPSGSLSVKVTRPDGQVELLGPAPFVAGASRAPASAGGALLDNGGGHLAEVFQLTTNSGAFDYAFTQYGKYSIEAVGTVEDVYGNQYEGGGTYVVFAAEPLDIEPATLPMTPFEVGDSFNPGVTVLPGVPAEVEVHVSLLVESDSARAVDYTVKGKANRFGIFTAPADAQPVTMTGPGEFVVETTATYTDSTGVLWMGSTRWGQVVAPQDTSLIAHGRRGKDDIPLNERRAWFAAPFDGTSRHLNLPFHSGDILWETADDAARVTLSADDREGAVQSAILDWTSRENYSTVQGPIAQRSTIGELPLGFATQSGINPALRPEEVVAQGYWYGGIQRPGERVREIISDDDAGTAYWRFGETYALQPGMGVDGDLPNDFKFQFGGVVFRDETRDLRRYGIYGSLWVQLPDDDPVGSRVFPPFQGMNGGPSGGPIMRLAGQDIDAFVVPLAVKPGSILETGDIFSFSALAAPTLPAAMHVTITGPAGFSQEIEGRANAIGYFYDPTHDFALTAPGVYHVAVTATFDTPTSAGPISPPYPTGTVIGAVNGGFDIFVVSKESVTLPTPHAPRSAVQGAGPIALLLGEAGLETPGTLRYVVGMPGHLLLTGSTSYTDRASITYDPIQLSRTFSNIDVRSGRLAHGLPGLADTIWISALLERADGTYQARLFTLQGPDLYAPTP